MPEELDPTTARLVSELAASILPSLTKSLSSAIPSVDFTGTIERTNRMTQDMRLGIEKAVRAGIDDSRAGRSMIIQSIGTVLEEVSALRRVLEKVPETLEAEMKKIKAAINEARKDDNDEAPVPEAVITELEGISGRIEMLTKGLTSFFETYAEQREQGISSLNGTDTLAGSEAISGLEGLVRAEGKSRSRELAEFSREISAMHEESSAAILHEVREAVSEEISGLNGGGHSVHSGNEAGNVKMLKITAGISGACLVMLVINFLVLLFR